MNSAVGVDDHSRFSTLYYRDSLSSQTLPVASVLLARPGACNPFIDPEVPEAAFKMFFGPRQSASLGAMPEEPCVCEPRAVRLE